MPNVREKIASKRGDGIDVTVPQCLVCRYPVSASEPTRIDTIRGHKTRRTCRQWNLRRREPKTRLTSWRRATAYRNRNATAFSSLEKRGTCQLAVGRLFGCIRSFDSVHVVLLATTMYPLILFLMARYNINHIDEPIRSISSSLASAFE